MENYNEVTTTDCTGLEVGDDVVRMLAGTLPHELKVTKIEGDSLWCGPWEFARKNGAEIDEDLGWSGDGPTGSVLTIPETEKE